MNKSSTKNRKDSGLGSDSGSTEPLMMSQSFDMTPIPSGVNSYTKNFGDGDHHNMIINNNNNKTGSDIDLTQPKAIEDGTNIGQSPNPHKKKTRVFSKEKLVNMNPMPDSNVRETPFCSESMEESTHTEKCPDLPRGASFPGAQGAGIHDKWGYLTPADPPPYPHVGMPVSSTSDPLSNSTTTESNFNNTGSGKLRHQRFQRFDSGIGDEQSERGSSTLSSVYEPPNSPLSRTPRLSTHQEQLYEDIDHYQRAQESREPRRSIDKHGMSNGSVGPNNLRPLPAVRVSGITQDESEDYDSPMKRSIAETVSTPTSSYPQETQSHAYTPFPVGQKSVYKSKKSGNCQGRCCVVLTFSIILLISLAALAVSIYLLATRPEGKKESVVYVTADGQTSQNLTEVLNEMKAEIDSLKEKLKTSAATGSGSETSYAQLTQKQDNLTIAFHNLESKLETQIANISRTPGPEGPRGPEGPQGIEGPPGIANFSGCTSKSISSTAVANGDNTVTNTSWMPPAEDLEHYYPHFAYCEYSGATIGLVDVLVTDDGPRYRCICKGARDQERVYCYVHVWMCPRGYT